MSSTILSICTFLCNRAAWDVRGFYEMRPFDVQIAFRVSGTCAISLGRAGGP